MHDTDRRGRRRDVLLDAIARGVGLELDAGRGTRRAFVHPLFHPPLTVISSFKRTRRQSASGTFRSSHRERTWSRHSKTAARSGSTTLRLLRRPEGQRTSPRCTFPRRTRTARCLSSRRQRGPSSRVRPPACRFCFARAARVHVFMPHHDHGAHRGRWQPACFVVHNRTPMRYVEAYWEDGAGGLMCRGRNGVQRDAVLRACHGFPVATVSG